MSLRWNARLPRGVLAVVCTCLLVVASAAPAAAGKKQRRHYTVKNGPCEVEKLPKGASHQWTPGGESIVHEVRYGQGLQDIAWSYGFKGDTAFHRLWDANPQLDAVYLERPGIVLRIPVCGADLRQRALPKPPPPPEPEPAPDPVKVAAPSDSTPAEPDPAPKKKRASSAPAVPSGSVWDKLAECESGGDWSINTGNGYYGGLQFSASSWKAVGGTGLPHEHSREEQIKRGELLLAAQGWGAWPACSSKLGLR